MKAQIRELCSGENGRISSKRVMGIVTLLCALVYTWYVIVYEKDASVLFYPYTTAGALLGIGVLEGVGKRFGGVK